MRFIPSLGMGLLLGLANFVFWRFSARWVVSKGEVKKGFVAFLSIIKLGILAAILWVLIVNYKVNAPAFLLGFSGVIVLTLAKLK